MGNNFRKFCMKIKKDLQRKTAKDKASKLTTGKNDGKVWKG